MALEPESGPADRFLSVFVVWVQLLFCFFVLEVFAPCVFIGCQFLLLFLWLLLVFLVPCSHQAVLMVWLQTSRAYGDSKAHLISSSSSCFILIMLSRVCLSCFYFLSFASPFVFLVHIPASLSRLNPSVQLERTCSEFVPLSWRSWSQFERAPPTAAVTEPDLYMLIISYLHLWTYSACLCVISLCNRSWLNCYKRFLVCVGSQSPGSWEKAAGGRLLFPRMFAEVFFSSKVSRVFEVVRGCLN